MADRSPSADRAAQLLTAATELFIERGYRDVDVADIAARTGVSHGTFYNYFRNKRNVLEAMLRTAERDLAAAVSGDRDPTSIATREDFVAEFGAKVRRAIDYVAANDELMSFIALTAGGIDDDAYTSSLEGYRKLGVQITEFMTLGKDRGWVRDDIDLDVVGQVVVSCVAAAVLPVLLGDDAEFDTTVVAQTCTGYLLGGMRTALPSA